MTLPLFRAVVLLSLVAGCAGRQAPVADSAQTTGYSTRYNKPLTSLGAKFGALPPVVQNTVRAQAGPAEIADVMKDSRGDRLFYKIYFKQPELYPPLYVTPDGSVLNPDLTIAVPAPQGPIGLGASVSINDLPPIVLKTAQERAPDAEISHASREMWGERMVYVISFKEEARHPKL